MQKFSDDDLIKYAEGRLSSEQASAIEAWIAANPGAGEVVDS